MRAIQVFIYLLKETIIRPELIVGFKVYHGVEKSLKVLRHTILMVYKRFNKNDNKGPLQKPFIGIRNGQNQIAPFCCSLLQSQEGMYPFLLCFDFSTFGSHKAPSSPPNRLPVAKERRSAQLLCSLKKYCIYF